MGEKIIGVGNAAKFCGISPRTVARKIVLGQFPKPEKEIQIGQGCLRQWDASQLASWRNVAPEDLIAENLELRKRLKELEERS